MIRDIIESFGFARVTNSKYVKGDVTLVLEPLRLKTFQALVRALKTF